MDYKDCSESETQALLQAFSQHSLVSMADLGGSITYANEAFCQVSGYAYEELIGRDHRILNSGAHLRGFWRGVWETIAAGGVWRGVVCNRAKSGELYWVKTQISPVYGSSGGIEKYLSVRTDISSHIRLQSEMAMEKALKAAAESARQRDEYLRATLDSLPFHFWLKDLNGKYLAVNQAFAGAFGLGDAEHAVGRDDFELWPSAAMKFREIDQRVVQHRREEMRTELQETDSGKRWFEVFIKPLRLADGSTLGTVGFKREVTDRWLLKNQLQERTDLLQSILDLSPDGFVSFDADSLVNYVSPVFSRLTGIESHCLVGLGEKECSDVLRRACYDGGCFGGIAELRALAEVSGGEVRKRLEIVNGGRRVIEIALRINDEGRVSQILCFRDVTLESQVEDMKSEFLSTAAHELRTPMTSILGFTEVLMTQSLTEEHRSELQGIIYRQSELMASILNELLDLARIEARRGKDFVFQPTQVQALLAQVSQSFKVPTGRANPSLEMPNQPLHIMADAQKLTQVLVNVLSNAYKYSPAGGEVSLTVLESVDTLTSARMIGVQTTDHGIGMTAEQVKRIFERFYRADTSGKVLGTGLGMSIVYEIVTLHGGRVDVHSAPGGGTRVTFWIPAALVASPH